MVDEKKRIDWCCAHGLSVIRYSHSGLVIRDRTIPYPYGIKSTRLLGNRRDAYHDSLRSLSTSY